MKKGVLVVVIMVLFASVLISCNQSVCPAYVIENQAQQVNDNG